MAESRMEELLEGSCLEGSELISAEFTGERNVIRYEFRVTPPPLVSIFDRQLWGAAIAQVRPVEELLAYIGRITKDDLRESPAMVKEELDAHVREIRAAQMEGELP